MENQGTATALQQERQAERTEPMGTAELADTGLTNRTNISEKHAGDSEAQRLPMFAENELGDFRRQWQDVQASFVDDPRTAVRNADELVASLMTRLARIFADERGKLEHDWDKGEDVSTEDLRVALRRYRSFFDRLLSV
jgi:hypothetical protein